MPLVFIGIGSNLGDRKFYFNNAADLLRRDSDILDLRCSPVYETDPVGSEGQPKYWNAVWSIETQLDPHELLKRLHAIEAGAGRVRKAPNDARTLDLDILFYGNQVIKETGLRIPHPRLQERAFVLVPFCDLAPEWVHPVLNKTMRQLLQEVDSLSKVRRKAYGEQSSPYTVPRTEEPL